VAYGVALDIGTTTVLGSLINLDSGCTEKQFSCLNAQLSYGHDVITRLNHAATRKNGLKRLNKSIVSSVGFVLDNLAQKQGIEHDGIESVVAVGNAVMYHFVFNLPITSFITPPYKPYKTEEIETTLSELGIENFPKTHFKMLPNVDGFIGSDALAVILATGLYKDKANTLAIDIGTNGEIMLGSKDGILVSSTAAGPAFESWHTSSGMRAVEGAIERAKDQNGKLLLRVIGGKAPQGISGSGMIDIISILLKRGQIDKTGKLKDKKFVVYDDIDQIAINQKDIREVQLAKAAFSVGIKMLRTKQTCSISKIYLTGTFGSYINKKNAQSIGLIPKDIDLKKVEFISQGALTGAEMVLKNPDLEGEIADILFKTEHIPLAEDKSFQNEFASAMIF